MLLVHIISQLSQEEVEQSVSILSHTCPGAQCVVVGGSGTRGCCGTRVRGPVKVISLVLGPATQACLKGAGHAGCGQSTQQLHVNAGQQHRGEWPHKAVLKATMSEVNECQHWSTAQRWATTQSMRWTSGWVHTAVLKATMTAKSEATPIDQHWSTAQSLMGTGVQPLKSMPAVEKTQHKYIRTGQQHRELDTSLSQK